MAKKTKIDYEVKKIIGILFNQRTKCSNNCAFFVRCPYSVFKSINAKNRDCEVVKLPLNEQKRFALIYGLGEEGLKSEIMNVLWEFRKIIDITNDPRSLKTYIEMLATVARLYRPSKKQDESDTEDIEISMKVMPVKKNHNKPTKNTVVSTDNDPESLLSSDNLDAILVKRTGKVPNPNHEP